jgi:hypothetical protein
MDLTEEQKTFIVQKLACFLSPSEVVEDVKEEFGIEISRMQVRTYNPKQCVVAKKWKELFNATRAKYLDSAAELGAFHQVFRLDQAMRLLRKAGKNLPFKRELLEYMAKEAGGAFTNKRTLDGNLNVSIDSVLDDAAAYREERRKNRKGRK